MVVKIQYISNKNKNFKEYNCSVFSEPKALDVFDINIIDLNDEDIWKNNDDSFDNINCEEDLMVLGDMIENSKKSTIIILFPQNLTFYYNYNKAIITDNPFKESIKLNKIPYNISCLVKSVFNIPLHHDIPLDIGFEENSTKIGKYTISSSFYFKDKFFDIFSMAEDTEKITTIKDYNIICTTLNLKTPEEIQSFINYLKLSEINEELPKWLVDFSFYNDGILKSKFNRYNEEIETIQNSIKILELSIEENEKIKSILITNGDDLVRKIFYIIKTIFGVDLTNFKDKKKEDFIFEYHQMTFIGEIKGVTSNVKKSHISQLDDHYANYMADLLNQGINKEVKQVLIITHQRDKELSKRQPVSNDVIEKAEKNQTIIIETITLLNLYEKFLKEEIDSEYIFNLLKNRIGLLTI